MNPQTVWFEKHKQVVEKLWDNMPEDFRKTVANDSAHKTKAFAHFERVALQDADHAFAVWQKANEGYLPATHEAWLNPVN